MSRDEALALPDPVSCGEVRIREVTGKHIRPTRSRGMSFRCSRRQGQKGCPDKSDATEGSEGMSHVEKLGSHPRTRREIKTGSVGLADKAVHLRSIGGHHAA